MPEILYLNLHREFFVAIAAGRKRIEYRKQSPYWRKRLEDRKYDAISFRNGYANNAPDARARVNVNLELSRSRKGVRNGFRRPDGPW
jgi:hypothetical protein